MACLDDFARDKLGELAARSLRRELTPTARGLYGRADRDGRTLVSFSCNDYLGLSQHAAVKRAAIEAVEAYGAGAGASRLVTGDHPLNRALEDRLARLKGTEDAVVFGSGYLANIGIVPALAGEGDLVVVDELSHACLRAGARLSRAASATFRHNDTGDLARILAARRRDYRNCLILTEGVFSMDGDRAPLAALSAVAHDHDCWLMVDDAHGLGVIGGGRGSVAAADGCDVPLQMGTLSKAAGCYGGYLCCSRPVAELMRNRARSFVYTTGLPPAAVGAAIAALDIIAADPALCARPLTLARRFARRTGLAEPESAIVPLIVGSPERALAASARLAESGFLVTAIRPPTVPDGTARLRFAFSAAHADEDVDALAEAVRAIGLAEPHPAAAT
jgi:8-amino-7-oxononanoate synthase